MAIDPNDARLLEGGRGVEREIPGHMSSPTWIVDKAYEAVSKVAFDALDAYMSFCKDFGLPHSYILGLDILITGRATEDGTKITDIRPTLLEGPCCNSYPACPNFFASRLYKTVKNTGLDPAEYVEYPVHPLKVREELVHLFQMAWEKKGRRGKPTIAVLTRPYPESEEETAHELNIEAFRDAGYKCYRITPDESPEVRNGKLYVHGNPIDMCYRRIERVHVPMFYGWQTAMDMIENCPNTDFINPWKIDDLRSKTIEERAFRFWAHKTGVEVSRPETLLGNEINPAGIEKLLATGGYALKKWNSTGGKGVFLHVNEKLCGKLYDKLYLNYKGRHMTMVNDGNRAEMLAEFENFSQDAAIQQMRIIDARKVSPGEHLVYDTRCNVFYDAMADKWKIVSGISRTVPCGPEIDNGNTLLTNVSSGAHLSPLVMGKTRAKTDKMTFGPLLEAMLKGKTECEL